MTADDATTGSASRPPTSQGRRPSRGPVTLFLDLFSSVRLGIVLLVILFVYSTVGSAGIILPTRGPADFTFLWIGFEHSMLRQWRPFELTEFEWFHTAYFNGLIGLICLNIIVTTLRRIRLSTLNLGVWMIHSGIIMLCIGSIIYFGTKVEGDAPVMRREVVIQVPGVEAPVRLAALPGASTAVMSPAGEYTFRVVDIDPNWSLRTAGDEGRTAFAVTVNVTTPTTSFARTMLAGFPEYTEDVIPGKGRVKKLEEFGGKALVDESLKLSLAPRPTTEFWLRETAAVYARPKGALPWSMRPIEGLPRYNDYVSAPERDVWPVRAMGAEPALRPSALALDVQGPGDGVDPLGASRVRITGYLRYAVLTTGWTDGGSTLNPLVDLTLRDANGDLVGNETLLAFDPRERSRFNGNLVFEWVNSVEELARFEAPGDRSLTIRVPATGEELKIAIDESVLDADPDRPLTPIGETGFAYKVINLVDRLPLSDGTAVTLLRVQIQTPESTFTRWVFEDPARNRDNAETRDEDPHAPQPPDPRIETVFNAGHSAPLTIVAGPGEVGVRVYSREEGQAVQMKLAPPGTTVDVVLGMRLTIRKLVTNAVAEVKPQIIPWQQRDKDADSSQLYALVQVEISGGGRTETHWVPFHRYAFESRSETPPNLSRFEPVEFSLADGSKVEVVVSRERRALPNPVLLDDFILTTNIGGFSGSVSSIRDWTSVVQFEGAEGLSTARTISTNAPQEYGGMWFFQAFWDAPQPGRTNGLAFTGLGVGNRNGVYTQLAGCCIAVTGMLYAFYVKPIIRRRRKDMALAAHAARATHADLHPERNGAGEHAMKAAVAGRLGAGAEERS